MRKVFIAVVLGAIAISAAGQQPLQCVNPDILNGVIFFGRSEEKVEVTRELPAFMKGFRTPADFSLIGTGERGGGILTTVAYKTALTAEQAYSVMLAALGADGWGLESAPGSAQTFRISNGPRDGTVCRNGERRSLIVRDAAGVRYVDILAYPQQRPRDCNAPDPAANMPFFGQSGPLPRFQFPAGTGRAVGGGGGGGSDNDFTQSVRIISATETPASLVQYLASQMEGQGWHQDAAWSGAGNAGSTWRKTIDGELRWSTLQIARAGEGTYDVDLTLTR